MKNPIRNRIAGFLLGSLLCAPAYAGDEPIEALLRAQMDYMVQEQYAVAQSQLQAELSYARAKLRSIETERAAVLQRARSRADLEANGIELLRKYDALLAARYVDKKGEFVPGLEIAPKDVENLNDLTKSHLSAIPLSGRVSAGQARKTISWAIERLEDLVSDHRNPSESNNSELEILGKLARDEELRSRRALNLAESLGLTLDPEAASPAPLPVAAKPSPAPPASKKKPKQALKKKK